MKQEKIKPENYYYLKSKYYYKITLSAFLFSLLMISISTKINVFSVPDRKSR
jgi:hypothetical protein